MMQTYQTAPTNFVSIDNVKIAYRRLGIKTGIPLVYITHLRGSMDILDPLFVNAIAATREIILLDNAGIGHSEGTVPDTIHEMASTVVNLLAKLDVSKADVMGFSMGGGTAQYIAMEYPHLVNKLILAGTQPGIGEGIVLPPRDALETGTIDQEPTEEQMMHLFFYPSETSLTLGHAWWKRIHERQVAGEERKGFLVGPGVRAQLSAIFKFATDPVMFDRLKEIKVPVLVTNGHTDVMSPSQNSFVLQQELPRSQLLLYPDAGHGHLFQEPELYAKGLSLFLDN